jgi:hypothetical protein
MIIKIIAFATCAATVEAYRVRLILERGVEETGHMAERFSFLALEDDFELIAAWFAKIPHEVTVNERPDRLEGLPSRRSHQT